MVTHTFQMPFNIYCRMLMRGRTNRICFYLSSVVTHVNANALPDGYFHTCYFCKYTPVNFSGYSIGWKVVFGAWIRKANINRVHSFSTPLHIHTWYIYISGALLYIYICMFVKAPGKSSPAERGHIGMRNRNTFAQCRERIHPCIDVQTAPSKHIHDPN